MLRCLDAQELSRLSAWEISSLRADFSVSRRGAETAGKSNILLTKNQLAADERRFTQIAATDERYAQAAVRPCFYSMRSQKEKLVFLLIHH